MTNSAAKETKFWDKLADRYAKQPIADEAAYQHKLEVTRGYFRPDMNVLEIGCGTGSTALVHAPHVKHIRATDCSSKMIEIAKDKASAAGIDNVDFEQSSVDELSDDAETYDVVLALSLLHLLDDKKAAVEKVHRLLKPGGVFATSTPCLADAKRFLPLRAILPVLRVFGLVPKVRFFTSAALKACLTDAGFDVDYEWRPAAGKATFIVATKTASPAD